MDDLAFGSKGGLWVRAILSCDEQSVDLSRLDEILYPDKKKSPI